MVDLDRAFDLPAAESMNSTSRMSTKANPPGAPSCGSNEGARDVEQVIDRLAEEHRSKDLAPTSASSAKPGNGLNPARGGMGQLVGRGIEYGRGGPECVPDGAGDDPGRAADVEHAPRGRRQREPQKLDELGGVELLLLLHRLGVDQAAVVGAHERAIRGRVEVGVLRRVNRGESETSPQRRQAKARAAYP